MKNRSIIYICLLLLACTNSLYAKGKKQNQEQNDRAYWCSLLYRISEPVLSNMSKGELRKNMTVELSPNWLKGREHEVTYLETFGR